MPDDITLDDVQRALTLADFDHEAAWQRMAPTSRNMQRPPAKPGSARSAGVLLLLYPHSDGLTFVLTKRANHLPTHKGQISLPGGGVEPGDDSTWETALRETCEEIGVCDYALIEPLGRLTPLYVNVSDFEIAPYAAYTAFRPEYRINPNEVDFTLEMPLTTLVDDAIKDEETWTLRNREFDVPFYRFRGHIIWGATAIILSEFEGRLRAVLSA